MADRLDLPPGWQIHPTFHVSSLQCCIRHLDFEREVEPPPPKLVDGQLEYTAEAILRHHGRGARCRYLVVWKAYPLTEATWEPESNLSHAPVVLADSCAVWPVYHRSHGIEELEPSQSVPARIYHRPGLHSGGKGTGGDGLVPAWFESRSARHSRPNPAVVCACATRSPDVSLLTVSPALW